MIKTGKRKREQSVEEKCGERWKSDDIAKKREGNENLANDNRP